MLQKPTEQVFVKISVVYHNMDILLKDSLRKNELEEFKQQAFKLRTFTSKAAKGNEFKIEMDLFFLLFRQQKQVEKQFLEDNVLLFFKAADMDGNGTLDL